VDKERNKVILNPYAREPSDYYEKDFDKKFSLNKIVMPHLYNTICVIGIPKYSSSTKEACKQLKESL
jgi:hypothetical protein